MKILMVSLVLSAFAATTALKANSEVLTVAVFDFESKEDGVRDLGPKLASLVTALLAAEPTIVTVERAELQKVLGEQELGLSGAINSDTAAKVGHLTGAKVLVTGRLFKVEKETVLAAKIMSSETSRVYGEVVKNTGGRTLTDMAEILAKRVSTLIAEKGDTLRARAGTREERITKVLKSLQAGERPTVSVRIPEEHFGARVIDPAAETEICNLLQRAGFKVIDNKAGSDADVEISGEAFSAFGLRKENLVSCKARVEIKALEKRSGAILLADRQTSVALDITEQTAAKTALQNAAVDLAERLLPALTRSKK